MANRRYQPLTPADKARLLEEKYNPRDPNHPNYLEGGFTGSEVSGMAPSGLSFKNVKDAFKERGDTGVDERLNKVLDEINKEHAQKYRNRPRGR